MLGSNKGYGGSDDEDSLFWIYPELQESQWENTLIHLPHALSSLSHNSAIRFSPLLLIPSENTAATAQPPPLLPPLAEDVTHFQDIINSKNKTHDHSQKRFLDGQVTCATLAPTLPLHAAFSYSHMNRSLLQNPTSPASGGCKRWTKQEHRLFLEGLEIYGKGNWKKISRYIKTRTNTQVASHAQKYFIRREALNKNEERKRKSICDMTLEDEERVSKYPRPAPQQINQPQELLVPFNPSMDNISHHQMGEFGNNTFYFPF